MNGKTKKGLLTTSLLFSALFLVLAFAPHRTCGCGQYEDGSQLTHYINRVSEKLVGVPLIETNPNPFK